MLWSPAGILTAVFSLWVWRKAYLRRGSWRRHFWRFWTIYDWLLMAWVIMTCVLRGLMLGNKGGDILAAETVHRTVLGQ